MEGNRDERTSLPPQGFVAAQRAPDDRRSGHLERRPLITDIAAHAEAKEAFEQAKYERDRDEVLVGRAIDVDVKEGTPSASSLRHAANAICGSRAIRIG